MTDLDIWPLANALPDLLNEIERLRREAHDLKDALGKVVDECSGVCAEFETAKAAELVTLRARVAELEETLREPDAVGWTYSCDECDGHYIGPQPKPGKIMCPACGSPARATPACRRCAGSGAEPQVARALGEENKK